MQYLSFLRFKKRDDELIKSKITEKGLIFKMPNPRLEKILQLFKEDPQNTFLLYALGLEYQSELDFEKSIEYFEKLRDFNPDYLGLYYPLVGLYHRQGKIEKAQIRLREGIQIAQKLNNWKTRGELEELSHSIQDFED